MKITNGKITLRLMEADPQLFDECSPVATIDWDDWSANGPVCDAVMHVPVATTVVFVALLVISMFPH